MAGLRNTILFTSIYICFLTLASNLSKAQALTLTFSNEVFPNQTNNFPKLCSVLPRFKVSILGGIIMTTCIRSRSAFDQYLKMLQLGENSSEDKIRLMQIKASIYLLRDTHVAVCALKCSNGDHSKNNSLNIDVGCKNWRSMQCRDTCSPAGFTVDHGKVNCTNGSLGGSLCRVQCSPGYLPVGPKTRLCNQSSLTWQPAFSFHCEASEVRAKRYSCHQPTSKRTSCSSEIIDNEVECMRRKCCWDKYLVAEYRCYRISHNGPHYFPPTPKTPLRRIHEAILNFYRRNRISLPKKKPNFHDTCGCPALKKNPRSCPSPFTQSIRQPPLPNQNFESNEIKKSLPVPRIFHGENATSRDWPWHAVVNINRILCGGTLITPQHVITAAHCITSDNMSISTEDKVILGISNLVYGSRYMQIRQPKRIIRHQNFSYIQNIAPSNDLAIIELNRPVYVYGNHVRTLCLPSQRVPQPTDECFVTGFGKLNGAGQASEFLQQACLPIYPTNICQQHYSRGYVNTEQHICAGAGSPQSADTCRGDSGGPLVCRRAGTRSCGSWFLAGITSFGKSPCGNGAPSVYVQIYKYQAWIAETIKYLS